VRDELPESVLRADAAHHAVLQEVMFSRHLNPYNGEQARDAFLAGAAAPPFAYHPLLAADALADRLRSLRVEGDHPATALVQRSIDGTRLLVEALRDRSAAAFDALNQVGDWYPPVAKPQLPPDEPRPRDIEPMVGAEALIRHLRAALAERSLGTWTVATDPSMAARVLVDSARRQIRVDPQARLHPRELARLVVHEIDVHAWRTWNGEGQPLHLFSTGLPGSLATEEGLAMVAEERAGVLAPGSLRRQLRVWEGIHMARQSSFRELYDWLAQEDGPQAAWSLAVRLRRGLADQQGPGVYAKDSVYLSGYLRVRRWLDAGGSISNLYVGKVGVEDPVADWLDAGWLRRRPVPAWWG
jgi:hypothetical protein